MKLYTEEQVIKAMDGFYDSDCTMRDVINRLTPIELPSDEEMILKENALKFTEWMSGLIDSNFMSGGNWFCNGEIKTTEQLYDIWMKQQILNQTK